MSYISEHPPEGAPANWAQMDWRAQNAWMQADRQRRIDAEWAAVQARGGPSRDQYAQQADYWTRDFESRARAAANPAPPVDPSWNARRSAAIDADSLERYNASHPQTATAPEPAWQSYTYLDKLRQTPPPAPTPPPPPEPSPPPLPPESPPPPLPPESPPPPAPTPPPLGPPPTPVWNWGNPNYSSGVYNPFPTNYSEIRDYYNQPGAPANPFARIPAPSSGGPSNMANNGFGWGGAARPPAATAQQANNVGNQWGALMNRMRGY